MSTGNEIEIPFLQKEGLKFLEFLFQYPLQNIFCIWKFPYIIAYYKTKTYCQRRN
jgi:hypothetical protein